MLSATSAEVSRVALLRAQVLALQGHTALALQAYQDQLPNCPDVQTRANLYFACSRLASRSGDYKQAIAFGKAELECDPTNARIHHELAKLYQDKLCDYARALAHTRKALHLEVAALKNNGHSSPVDRQQAEMHVQATRRACGRLQFMVGGSIQDAMALSV